MKLRRLILSLLLFLLLSGCGDVAQPPLESPGEALPVLTEQAPEILAPALPGRNPFMPVAPFPRQRISGTVDRTGRDPFLPAPQQPAAPEPVLPPPLVPAERETLPAGLVIALQTVDRCWLDVFVDGQRVLRSNVASGQTLRWEAEREIVLQQVGREYAVRITVNGKELGLLSHLVRRLAMGENPGQQEGVRISLERSYAGGVLVGLRFSASLSQ